MIAPHEGQELALMLAGTKKVAMFCDVFVGESISEDIIPEKAFAPYVEDRTFIRHEELIQNQKTGDDILYVFFAVAEEDWRIKALVWLIKSIFEGQHPADDAHEYHVGRLLGYEDEDIAHFLRHRADVKERTSLPDKR